MSWIKNAFAVDPPGPQEPTEPQRKVIDKVCRAVVSRRMTTPAIVALQMSRPLNYLSSQAMHFFRPILATVTDTEGLRHFAEFVEHRGAFEYILMRLEEIEAIVESEEAGSSVHQDQVSVVQHSQGKDDDVAGNVPRNNQD
ncbi:MAG: hypothetical protein P8J86_11010 [Phycisphaerales bacterium]|nr:hypothetical protein [Phycisphaerales bacterium]